jgi:hypothetical protein
MWGIHAGRRVRGALSFGSFLWARKERNPSYGGGTPLVNNRRRCYRGGVSSISNSFGHSFPVTNSRLFAAS